MPVWIQKALVLAIHNRQLAEHGGTGGVRDEHLLESALARPQQLFAYGDPEPDLADLAASLAFGLVRNHPFVDGNRRTATVTCETFIELNDCALNASDAGIYPIVLGLAEGELPEQDFAAWLRQHVSANHGQRVQEPRTAAYHTHAKRRVATRSKR